MNLTVELTDCTAVFLWPTARRAHTYTGKLSIYLTKVAFK